MTNRFPFTFTKAAEKFWISTVTLTRLMLFGASLKVKNLAALKKDKFLND
jgi:hypothetical protein